MNIDAEKNLFEDNEPLVAGDGIVNYVQSVIHKDSGVLAELREYAQINRIPILHPEVAQFIRTIIKTAKPKRILEIGTAIGYSALLFADATPDTTVIDTIELDQDVAFSAEESICKAGYEKRINILVGDASDVLLWLKDSYDFIFLDGPKGQYVKLLPECVRLLEAGGVLLTDNIFYRGMISCKEDRIPRRRRLMVHRLREYVDTICSHEELDTSLITMGDGLAISVKKEKVD